jgi:peptidyl-prolyl cis-trans isomerase B (cyclophilin B)
MRSTLCLLALAAIGCSSADPSATSSSSDSVATATATTSTATAASTDTSTAQAAGTDTAAPTAPTDQGSKAATNVPVSSLINQNGKIDPGLPKTAAWGAKMPKDGDTIAILTTSEGRIVVKFFPQKAPRHVKNFVDLAKKEFYNGTKFHRVIPGFMIQGGDPNTKGSDTSTWGQGGPGYNVKAEFNDIPHTRGILSMARTGDPDGAGSQFFIMVEKTPSLDGQYSVFGQVIEGMDVADKIVNTPRGENDRPDKDMVLKKVEITKWPIKLKS